MEHPKRRKAKPGEDVQEHGGIDAPGIGYEYPACESYLGELLRYRLVDDPYHIRVRFHFHRSRPFLR
jgi:hypothetical protein